ncbi:HAAS signaling domain-containing protein [Brevibacillus migulae]|uniref:HAAS signaling domain-containing protein n=1 Tax=Brevibacillus migulae TaxID=1644114 RepID=UPI00106EF879|nr:DUF1700 domain-containing protein [Brevibacillus migulae]
MTRREFIRELDQLLSELPDKERLDILADYTEHFLTGIQEGKNEEEIAAELGSPVHIASKYLSAYQQVKRPPLENPIVQQIPVQTANPTRAFLVTVALIFFNLIFVLGPYFGLVGILMGIYAGALSLLLSPVILFASLAAPVTEEVWGFTIFGSLAAGGLGILLAIGSFYVTKWFFRATVAYLKLNMKLIRGE